MKKHLIYSMALVLAAGLAGCDNELAEPPIPVPDGGRVGTGAWNNTMTAYQARIGSVNDTIPEPWVTGYIVGYVNTNVSNVLSAACAEFTADDCTVNTNLLIAVDSLETDWEKCATVQLPSGAVRSALNLKDHKDNLGKLVSIKGTTGSKYCGAYGVRSVSEYNWGDKGIPSEPTGPVEALPYLYENFQNSDKIGAYIAQGWVNAEVAGGLSGWYIKDFNGGYYITVSAYLGNAAGGPYENWLITPPVDLSKSNSKTLTFETQAAYPAEDSYLEVYVMDSNDVKTAVKTKLDAAIATPPEKNYSAWVKSGTIDLSGYNGVVYIGWRYYSAHGGSGASTTYCVDNVNVGGAPETPNNPGTEDVIYSGLLETSATCDWQFDNVNLASGLSYVWSWKEYNGNHYLNGSAYFNKEYKEALSYAYSPEIDLTGKTKVSVSFEHAAKFQTTLKELCGFAVRESGSKEWTDLTIPNWPGTSGWTFVNSGDIDLSAYAGKKIEIAFKYGSSSAGADTWEVKNVKVTGK